ncbi:helix-turn-helix domain-containing protein [Lacrimispora amygdalina]|uniref:helix-turn-helix domain-containing protein n=1 Tax=Lacrimispora amygdalina TaxID=253257 RepID=UPI000BE39418|nr:helix-turn-helix transcriptional regulator [Lacrimispora amygdalina]
MLNYLDEQLTSKEMHINIAKRLHSERKKSGFTLDTLAEKTGYTKPTVQSWEKGWKDGTGLNNIPSLVQLLDLASVYNCTPEYLLCEYDQKSKQLTDVSFETGLLPESIKLIHAPFAALLEQPMDQHGYYHIMYQFLNHLIKNCYPLDSALYNRIIVENIHRRFDASEYKSDIIEGFNAVSITRNVEFAIMSNRLSPEGAIIQYTQAMKAYYMNKGFNDKKISNILNDFRENYIAVSPEGKKQANFTLTSCFMDLVTSFLDSYPANVDSYKDFVDTTREAHIDKLDIK